MGSQHIIIRVGIIGCGEVAQITHIPNLNYLAHKFRITYLCDVSKEAIDFCVQRIQVRGEGFPKTTRIARELCASDDVDVVIVCNADEYHVEHGLLALEHNKFCMIEKPLALCFRDCDRLIAAEKQSKGRVFVGTMRRYAPALIEAVEEVRSMDKILYARVRSIVPPNDPFVNQSGTFPMGAPSDLDKADVEDRREKRKDIMNQALQEEFGVAVTDRSMAMLSILGALNTHDLSAMRELIGMPKTCLAASLGTPGFWTAMLQYDNFPVTFESGKHNVPLFDANIEIYGLNKIVKVQYDTPYIRNLPVMMTVQEKVDGLTQANANGFSERVVRRTFEDPFLMEMHALYECVANGAPVKTSAEDARQDLVLFQMILKAGEHNYFNS